MTLDAVVVGAGPNGLAAAVTLARAGKRVRLIERHAEVGGGLSSAALTLPGFTHDVGSAIHPLAAASPALREWPLHAFGLRWVHSPAPFAQTLAGDALAGGEGGVGSVTLERSLEETAEALGLDGAAWTRLFAPLVRDWEGLLPDILRPLPRPPRHPLSLARFGLRALPPADWLGETLFRTQAGRALWLGLAAHSALPLSTPGTSAMALVLGLTAHAVGWPFPAGGAGALSGALRAYFEYLGGEVQTGTLVRSARDLPPARATLVDSSPGALLELLGERAPEGYRQSLRAFRYGAGMQKFDYALSGPVPWADPRLGRAATVHIAGSAAEIRASEAAPARGQVSDRPYLLAAQHTPFDPSRAPGTAHTLWVYAHTPNGSDADITPQVEAQLERFAPGFSRRVLARRRTRASELQAFSPVFVGGDVNGGASTLWQLLARPNLSLTPYRTPVSGFYLCSSSTPPGGGIHGMCGVGAARTALRDLWGEG